MRAPGGPHACAQTNVGSGFAPLHEPALVGAGGAEAITVGAVGGGGNAADTVGPVSGVVSVGGGAAGGVFSQLIATSTRIPASLIVMWRA